jgi:COP9 signalosome complex subunit 1
LFSLPSPETFDSSITGRTRFDRLFLIGKCSAILSLDALRLAVAEAKSGKDVERYELAVEALSQAAPHDVDAVLDQRWVDVTKQIVRAETDKLEHELKGYKNNLIKESIRVGSLRRSDNKEETDLYRWEPMI